MGQISLYDIIEKKLTAFSKGLGLPRPNVFPFIIKNLKLSGKWPRPSVKVKTDWYDATKYPIILSNNEFCYSIKLEQGSGTY